MKNNNTNTSCQKIYVLLTPAHFLLSVMGKDSKTKKTQFTNPVKINNSDFKKIAFDSKCIIT